MPTGNTVQTGELWKAILGLKNTKEAEKFFHDLLTEQEISEFSKRWQAAKMLDGKIPYSTIEKETGLSSTTVARISKWLNKGMGGYRLMLNRLSTHHHHHHSSSFGKGSC